MGRLSHAIGHLATRARTGAITGAEIEREQRKLVERIRRMLTAERTAALRGERQRVAASRDGLIG